MCSPASLVVWLCKPRPHINTLLCSIGLECIKKLKILFICFQTFVVVSRGKDIFRFSATDAMWILDPFNPIRRTAIYVLVHPIFSVFIITTILTNCVLMIMPSSPTVESTE